MTSGESLNDALPVRPRSSPPAGSRSLPAWQSPETLCLPLPTLTERESSTAFGLTWRPPVDDTPKTRSLPAWLPRGLDGAGKYTARCVVLCAGNPASAECAAARGHTLTWQELNSTLRRSSPHSPVHTAPETEPTTPVETLAPLRFRRSAKRTRTLRVLHERYRPI